MQRRAAIAALSLLLCVAAAYLVERAITVRVEYSDGYAYLKNAAWLNGERFAPFDPIRPPLISLLLAPVVALARRCGPDSRWLLVGPHLAMAVLSMLAVAATFRFVRRSLGTVAALLAAVLFALGTRLVPHYGVAVATDILVAGLVAATLDAYAAARARPTWGRALALALALAAAVAAKYSALQLVPVLIVVELIRRREPGGRRRWLLLGASVAGAVALCAALLLGLFARIHPGQAWSSLNAALRQARGAVGQPYADESRLDYLRMAPIALSLPTCALALLGVVVALRRREPHDLVPGATLVVLGGGIVVLVGHTESRYLLPAVPALLYFAARGAGWALARWPRAGALAVPVVVGLAVASGARQAWSDADGFFTSDLQQGIIRRWRAARGPHGRLLVVGRYHMQVPADPGPMPEDDYWNAFLVSGQTLAYLAAERVVPVSAVSGGPWLVREALASAARNGDAVVALSNEFFRTGHFTVPLPGPLPVVWTVERAPAAGAPRDTAQGSVFLPAAPLGDAWLVVRSRSGRLEVVSGDPARLPWPARGVASVERLLVTPRP